MAVISYVINAVNNASRVFNDISDAAVKLDVAIQSAKDMAESGISIRLTVDDGQLEAELTSAFEKAQAFLDRKSLKLKIGFDVNQSTLTGLTSTVRGYLKANPVTMPINFDVSNASVMRAVTAARAVLRANPITVPLVFNVSQASMMRVITEMRAFFKANPINVPLNITGVAATIAGLGGVATAAKATTAATNGTANSANRGGRAFGYFGAALVGLWGKMTQGTGKIQLFGGAFKDILPQALVAVGGIHLLADALLEIVAVVAPAAIALAAFGIPAAGVIFDMTQQIKNMNTIAAATGGKVGILTGGFTKLENAVKPQVYQQFGDILNILGEKTGIFQKIAVQTGAVLENFGARFTLATEKGGAFFKIISQGPHDLQGIGNVIANLGSILGAFIKSVPGYAVILLGLFAAFTKGVAIVANLAVPIIHMGLALHGAILYVGLFATAMWALSGPLTKAVLWFGGIIVSIGKFVIALATAEDAEAAFTVVTDALAAVDPLIWVGAAIGLIALLVINMHKGTSATDQWNKSLQNTIMGAKALDAAGAIMNAQKATTSALVDAYKKLDSIQQTITVSTGKAGVTMRETNGAYTAQLAVVNSLKGGSMQLGDEQNLLNYRVGALAKTYGGTTQAMALLNQAGITTKQLLDGSAESWAIIKTQVAGTYTAFKGMGIQTGVLGTDLQVMDKEVFDTTTAMTNLNGAWDDFIGNATKSQGAFDSLTLGTDTLSAAFKKAGGSFDAVSNSSVTVTHHLGDLKNSIGLGKATIDGLSKSSLELNQAFGQQVVASNALIDTWRTAGIAGNLFKEGVKDTIAPLTKYAQGSTEATAQLVALAQEAGYNGPASMKTLIGWLGNTHDATAKLKEITNQATIQESLLTTSMNNQGKQITGQLIGDIDQAILKYNGVTQAAKNYGNAIAKDGAQSSQAHAARQTLITDLINTGKAAGDTKTQIATMIAQVLKIPEKRALKLVMTGDGSYSISGTSTGSGQKIRNLATGGRVPGFGGGDKVPAMLEGGEAIVPKHLTPLVAPLLKAHNVPGFAAGGLVPSATQMLDATFTGNTDVLSGRYAETIYKAFSSTMETALVRQMRAAIKAAATAAERASTGGGGGVQPMPGGGSDAANAALARKMYPAWARGPEWTAWNNVAMRESGWNSYAANPTSDARGIAQNINGWGPNYEPGNAGQQIAWMINYIKGRYGDPIGAWAHEVNYGWYDQGGLLMPGVTMAVNKTGKPEVITPTPIPQPMEKVSSGGNQGYPSILMGYGPSVKPFPDKPTVVIAPGPGGEGAQPIPPPIITVPPPKHKVPLSLTWAQHEAAEAALKAEKRQLDRVKDLEKVNTSALAKAKKDHAPKAYINQLEELLKEEAKHAKNLTHRIGRNTKRADEAHAPNPVINLEKELKTAKGLAHDDARQLRLAIKDHAPKALIKELEKLRSDARAREKALEAAIKRDKDNKGGPPPRTTGKGGGGGGGGAGGGGGGGGGSVSDATLEGIDRRGFDDVKALLREMVTASRNQESTEKALLTAIKALLKQIQSNTDPKAQGAATASALNQVARQRTVTSR